MLEKQQPDILVIATWPKVHLEQILEGILVTQKDNKYRCHKGLRVEKG